MAVGDDAAAADDDAEEEMELRILRVRPPPGMKGISSEVAALSFLLSSAETIGVGDCDWDW